MELSSRLCHTENTKECQVTGKSSTPFSKYRLCWGVCVKVPYRFPVYKLILIIITGISHGYGSIWFEGMTHPCERCKEQSSKRVK